MEAPFQNVKTLLELRIARGIAGVPDGQVKLVRGTDVDGENSYALFVNNNLLGALDASVTSDKEAVFVGIEKMNGLLHLLTEEVKQ